MSKKPELIIHSVRYDNSNLKKQRIINVNATIDSYDTSQKKTYTREQLIKMSNTHDIFAFHEDKGPKTPIRCEHIRDEYVFKALYLDLSDDLGETVNILT
jgi:hypothetical protein